MSLLQINKSPAGTKRRRSKQSMKQGIGLVGGWCLISMRHQNRVCFLWRKAIDKGLSFFHIFNAPLPKAKISYHQHPPIQRTHFFLFFFEYLAHTHFQQYATNVWQNVQDVQQIQSIFFFFWFEIGSVKFFLGKNVTLQLSCD